MIGFGRGRRPVRHFVSEKHKRLTLAEGRHKGVTAPERSSDSSQKALKPSRRAQLSCGSIGEMHLGQARRWRDGIGWLEQELVVDWTYRKHSARGRDGAHGARGLTNGVAEHIIEVNMILWGGEESIAAGCN